MASDEEALEILESLDWDDKDCVIEADTEEDQERDVESDSDSPAGNIIEIFKELNRVKEEAARCEGTDTLDAQTSSTEECDKPIDNNTKNGPRISIENLRKWSRSDGDDTSTIIGIEIDRMIIKEREKAARIVEELEVQATEEVKE